MRVIQRGTRHTQHSLNVRLDCSSDCIVGKAVCSGTTQLQHESFTRDCMCNLQKKCVGTDVKSSKCCRRIRDVHVASKIRENMTQSTRLSVEDGAG
jgi:hypothetical protein